MPELTRRYIVMAMATEGPFDMHDPDAPFVLKPWKDPAALRALEAYREHCYPELAQEIGAWIKVIRSGRAHLGGVGSRNQLHLAVARKTAPKARVAARGKKKAARAKLPRRKGKRRP
ncbi:MAG TPA: hypothetical protein VFO18_01500 [Methylomirabilota bacterium]|nr:hypothetical protein [Methylomirabilota bacterium]